MLSSSEVDDHCARWTLEDKSDASHFRRDAEAAAAVALGAELSQGGMQLRGAAVDGPGYPA